jgi:predicted DCC family thiol-disulfide oxidoreductase YuxK
MDHKRPIVFFDDKCAFCLKMVKILSQITRSKKLYYAPFSGKTAQQILLKKKPKSLIYYNPLNDQKVYRMKAVFLSLGHAYPIFKFLSPVAFLLDPFYLLIARFRTHFKVAKQSLPKGPLFLP